MIGLNRARGLAALRECLRDASDEVKNELDSLEVRLREHVQLVRRYGYDSSSAIAQARIDDALNVFARDQCGVSFVALCDGESLLPRLNTPSPLTGQLSQEASKGDQTTNTHPPSSPAQRPHADILLVTVTNVEARAVLDLLHAQFGRVIERRHVGDKTYYDLGSIGGATVAMVQSEMGSGGLGAALLTVQKGIDALAPVAVIMVGIAFGTDPKKQRIGDVLVARQLMLYEPQRLGQTKEGTLELHARGDRSPASSTLLDKFRSGVLDWQPPAASVRQSGAVTPQVHFGLIVSGEKLVDNHAFRDQLLRIEPDAIGGEMEGAGLYVAAHDHKVEWILVKAICDWADGNKGRNKKQRQQLAAQNAAEFVFHVLKLGGIAQLAREVKHNATALVTQHITNDVSNQGA